MEAHLERVNLRRARYGAAWGLARTMRYSPIDANVVTEPLIPYTEGSYQEREADADQIGRVARGYVD
jgi:hypothetical protein